MRLIDADAVLHELGCDNCHFYGTAECQSIAVCRGRHKLMNAPTIDPVKHGHWIEHDELICYESQCNVCGAFNHICKIKGGCTEGDKNFCPNCGARMDGGMK